jgi:hypothetical protein
VTTVVLTDAEKAAVAALAALRLVHSLGAGLGQGHGRGTQHRLSSELTAMAAEYAVSKALGLHWPLDLGRFHQPDVGGYHVRSCQKDGCLILRTDDPPNEPFVLVEADGPAYRLLGWCYPANVRRPEFWSDKGTGRPPAWFVPREALQPLEELVA